MVRQCEGDAACWGCIGKSPQTCPSASECLSQAAAGCQEALPSGGCTSERMGLLEEAAGCLARACAPQPVPRPTPSPAPAPPAPTPPPPSPARPLKPEVLNQTCPDMVRQCEGDAACWGCIGKSPQTCPSASECLSQAAAGCQEALPSGGCTSERMGLLEEADGCLARVCAPQPALRPTPSPTSAPPAPAPPSPLLSWPLKPGILNTFGIEMV